MMITHRRRLAPQGWFDNTITVNPYNDSIVYYGGRDASKATILPNAGATLVVLQLQLL